MSRALFVVMILLLALVGGEVTASREETRPLLAGILRGDGTVIPFAQYSNGGWTNPWPRPRSSATSIYSEETEEVIPHSLGNLPEPWFMQCGDIPRSWYFWGSAQTPRMLKASEVLQVENHSQTNWALQTDLPEQKTNDTHHHNLGVAVTINQKVEPWMQIQTDSPEAVDLLSFVRQIFPHAGDNAGNAELKQLYRSSSRLNGEYLYYFEAHKQHQQSTISTARNCNDISIFQGWITADEKGGMGLLDSRITLTDCDMKGPSFSTPLGIMTLKNTIFIFVSEHGWEDESYQILDFDRRGLHKVLETYGG